MHSCFDSNYKFSPLPPFLLKLSEKVNFTDHVRRINLASQGDHLPQRCIVSGWEFSRRKQMARRLREVEVTLVNRTHPAELHAYFSLGRIGPSKVSDQKRILMFSLFI
jgi:hypothetical protein